jgi:hypothetical protein
MAAYIIGIATNAAAASANLTINFPASWALAQNDVIRVGVASTSTADQNVTESSGTWAELADLYANDTTDVNMAVYRKVMGASPDTSITMDAAGTAANHVAIAVAWRGVDATTPEDAASTTATAIDSGTPNNNSITTVTDGAWVEAWAASSEAEVITSAPAADYLHLTQAQSGNIGLYYSAKKKDTAGAEDPATYAGVVGTGADSWAAVTTASRPAAGGPTNIPEKMIQYTRRRAA